MPQSPIFQTTCKDGRLFVDDMNISVVAPFNRVVWSIPRASVTNINQKLHVLTTEVEIYSVHGIFVVQTLPKQKASELVSLFFASPHIQNQQSNINLVSTPKQITPTGIPIDAEIQRIKLEIEQRRLQLSQVNANMTNIRSHYQQRHVHGGGKFGTLVRDVQRSGKDAKLKKQQPEKERLKQEKLALEQQLNALKIRKAQGATHITR